MKKYNLLAVEWMSAGVTVGFVAYATGNPANPGEWNSVVGYYPDYLFISEFDLPVKTFHSEDLDAQYIAANGAKIGWQIAERIFPQLDIIKHKYFPGDLKKNLEKGGK